MCAAQPVIVMEGDACCISPPHGHVAQSSGGSLESHSGYDCQLVHPPPSHIQTECSVCLQILREPCIVSCCGHKFCRECIERVRRIGKVCPLCNASDFSFMGEQSLDRTLNDLDVFCSYKSEGCMWQGKLRHLENHLNRSYTVGNQHSGCEFVEVGCVHPKCRVAVQRRFITAHQNDECKKRPVSCGYCRDYVSTFEDITHNHYSTCSRYPVSCPNGCSTPQMERHSVEQHLKDECPLTVINCPFHYTGCRVTLPRRNMFEHSQDIPMHFVLLGSFTQRLAQENKELRLRIAQVEEMAEKKQKTMLETISELSAVCCLSKHHIQHQEVLCIPSASKPFFVSSSILSRSTEMELRSMYFALLPYEFKMENFLNYKKGPVELSPVYYTHPFGYKFRVKVFRTEYMKILSLDAFTSIYIEILPGPFDDKLKWPFQGCICIEIVNQLSDYNHYRKMVRFSDKFYQGNRIRPDSSCNITCGIKPFIYHKELRNKHCSAGYPTHYLQDGSLHVCVTKIDVELAQ